jgi:hypothetical protein
MARTNSGSSTGGGRSRSSGSKSTGSRPKRRSSSSRKASSASRNGRSSSSPKRSSQDLPDYSLIDPDEIDEAVDVYVDAPVVKVDEIKFELDDLQAHLAVLAEAGHFVQLTAGAGVRLGTVELDIDLAQLEGTGSKGRVTVKDVRQAQEA